MLVYLYSEPVSWVNGRPVDPAREAMHRRETADFIGRVAGDEVLFLSLDYARLVDHWATAGKHDLAVHCGSLTGAFGLASELS